jgi:two-component system, OmpR family, response regulator
VNQVLQIAGASGFAESDSGQALGSIPLWLSAAAIAVLVFLFTRERRRAAHAAAKLQGEIRARQQTDTAQTEASADLERQGSLLPAELPNGTGSEPNTDEIPAMPAEELREPLASIRNAVHVLELINPADDRVVWARDVIERQVEQLSRLVEDLVNPPAKLAGPTAADTAFAARRLLVVDDNKDSAESLASLLKVIGNEVRTAYDGAAALAAVHTFAPDVVLLDIGLPEMDGYEVARQIRGRPHQPQPMLIALTGYGADEDQRRSYEAGFDHHLTKPVRFNTLQALLEAPAKTINVLPRST